MCDARQDSTGSALTRRGLLRLGSMGIAVSHLPGIPGVRSAEAGPSRGGGRARSCIVLFCWGGTSHLDTWDPKPEASREIRGEFRPLRTSVPGVFFTEHMPRLARQAHRLMVVRSVRHAASDHREAAYWNLTGHRPRQLGQQPVLPTRQDWPAIGSQVSRALYQPPSAEDRPDSSRFARQPDIEATSEPEVVAEKTPPPPKRPLEELARVSLSRDVLGAGHFPTGGFDRQDGYTNRGTVELIGMVSASAAAAVPLTRQKDGPVTNVAPFVAGDSTAGDWGSDTHGRGGNLYLPGAGEPNRAHSGFGAHANKFITFDLDTLRRKHFGGREGALRLTGRVGVNGAPAVPPTAVIQSAVCVDGAVVDLSAPISRDQPPHEVDVFLSPRARYLSLLMLNGEESTHYDDIAYRDVDLSLIDGDVELTKPVDGLTEYEPEPSAISAQAAKSLPRTVTLPYPVADRGLLNGQYGGFLGPGFDPVFVRPRHARPYKGVSPSSGHVDLRLRGGVTPSRFSERRALLERLELSHRRELEVDETLPVDMYRGQAMDMLLATEVQDAFDVRREPRSLRESYGPHMCGQSTLLARRLTEAGVPLVTVYCSSGDLNSGQGDHWDTHGSNFPRLKNDLLPPIDQAGAALLDDLDERGRLDETLVVFLTEFGRTPKVNGGGGRDHFPACYSVAFAGGGVTPGGVYGKSDRTGSTPVERACTPEDLHATIFHALGIDPDFTVVDLDGRPLPLSDGEPLPIF